MEPYKPHTQIQPFVTLCRIIAWVMVFGSLATVVLTRLSETRLLVWDDAYMFVRYADNIIATGHIAWNAGDSPTYGSTSLLHLLVVTIARLVFPHNPALTAFSSSIVCGVAFLALMVLLVEASARGTPALRLLQVVLVLLCVIFAGPSLAMHFESGMDTTCAMAYLALYIFMAKRWESSPSWPRIMAMMVVGGFAYFARPDLTLFALGVPLFAYLASPSARIRKHAAVAFVGTTGMILLQMLAAWEYFGSPVPLSFYAKSTKLYSESIYVALKAQPWNQLAEYLRQCWLLLPLVVAGQALPLLQTAMPRDRSQHISVEKPEKSVVDTGLFYATVLFVLYYLLLVLQVMPFESRFYYPTYPAIIFLGIQGLALVGGIVSVLFPTNKLPFVVRIGTMTIILALSLTLSGWVGAGFVSSFSRFFHSEVIHLNFDVKGEYRARWRNYWAELDTLSQLPDDLTIGATEIGRVVALNPRKRVIDLTGLNDTDIALNGFSGNRFFHSHAPDLIYMPHRNYRGILGEILASPIFQTKYRLFGPNELGAAFGVALRKDSRHYALMEAIIQRRLKPY